MNERASFPDDTDLRRHTVRDRSDLARQTVAVVLAGGRGTRLYSLTDWRAKPSVPFGGKFRIIDFTLSNCVNSGIRRIGICTQYRARSLIRHVQRGWSFLEGRFGEFVELLPAQQQSTAEWYKGTADAVYQNLDLLTRYDPKFVVVLAGDHIYKMDYGKMIEEHADMNVKMTVASIDVPVQDATQLGVIAIDEKGCITGFVEKPKSPPTIPGRSDRSLGSMGVYVFDAQYLYDELVRDARDDSSSHDFGKDIIPGAIRNKVPSYSHNFASSCVNMTDGIPYWRDVGTVDAYWEANLELTRVVPELNLYDEEWPIWTYQEHRPPAKFVFHGPERKGQAIDSLVSGGCIVSGSRVERSLLFTNVHVHSYCAVEDSVILPDVDVARHCDIRRAIIDSHCRLPQGFQVGVDAQEDKRRGFHVTEKGVVLVTPEMLGQPIHHLR